MEEITSRVTITKNRRRSELSSKFLGQLTSRQADRPLRVINLSQRTLNVAEFQS